MTEDAPSDTAQSKLDTDRARRAATRGREKLREVHAIFASIRDEVRGDRFWRYQRNVSPGLQEYIEALSFAHYLETGKLVSYDEVQKSLSDEEGVPFFPLPLEDYLLGLSDLTGELMRYAISSISRRGGRTKASEVCTFVRGCKGDFEALTPYFRELRKKQVVTSQSLEKIEDEIAAYAIAVRCSEYDLPPELMDDIVARTVSTSVGSGGAESNSRKKGRNDGFEDEYDARARPPPFHHPPGLPAGLISDYRSSASLILGYIIKAIANRESKGIRLRQSPNSSPTSSPPSRNIAMTLTFEPALGVRTTLPVPRDGYASFSFKASFSSREAYEQARDEGVRVEMWTNLPVGTNEDEWHALAFQYTADNKSHVKNASASTLNAEAHDQTDASVYLNVPLSDIRVGSTFSFTYRLVHPSGAIQWLGAYGQNGELSIEDFDPRFTLADGWKFGEGDRVEGKPLESAETEVAILNNEMEWTSWAFGKVG
ncbi:hypothetical protein PHLCEN_2v10982 [Hermanssonia centrifuga]|uniref:Uncharacterized protein n=1 Tax=Hermanssonia centrifuga TaxID=98765 RepID=A0A2R6NLA6_9APHY|nr:hypothetical protein PHLCEN_2v10982 [Hermanssonia centrifuga]